MSASHNKSRGTSTPVNMTPTPFKDLQSPFASALRNMFQNGFDLPAGPYTAPLTRTEGNLIKQTVATPTAAPSATGYLDKFLKQPNPYGGTENPFLESMISSAQRSTMQGLEETLTRSLPGRFTQNGQFIQPQGSSAFDRAAAIATRGAADASADIATNLSGQAFEGERNRAVQRDAQGVQAAATRQGITDAEINNMTTKLQAAALPRLIEQYGIDKGLELFQSQMDSMLAALGVAAGVTRPVIANTGREKSSGGGIGLK